MRKATTLSRTILLFPFRKMTDKDLNSDFQSPGKVGFAADPTTTESEIQKFFIGQNVLITGGTGFLGNVLIEKLLRCCPGINKIYLAVRSKKGKSISERMANMFSNPLFAVLHAEMPDVLKKVQPIHADLERTDCGMTEADRKLLETEISVVFHTAATVKFDAPLKTALNINTRATRDLIKLAKRMRNLKAFVHVSTAFSNCIRDTIMEQFYAPRLTGNAAICLIEGVDEDLMAQLAPVLMKQWPNSYVFTKNLAEDVIREMGENMPLAILRPGIVISTARSPIRGWINNHYGPTGAVGGAVCGVLRVFQANEDCDAEIVPVDYVVNAIIACAWNVGNESILHKRIETSRRTQESNQCSFLEDIGGIQQMKDDQSGYSEERKEEKSPIPIFNYISSNKNRIKWGNFSRELIKNGSKYPPKSAVWCLSLRIIPNAFLCLLYAIMLHFIPAIIIDSYLTLIGEKARFFDLYRKLHKFSTLLSFFSLKQWEYQDENVTKLWSKLSATDKNIFYFDLKDLVWEEYFHDYMLGLRKYLLHEPSETVQEGRKKRNWFLVAHYTLVLLGCLIFACPLWYLCSATS